MAGAEWPAGTAAEHDGMLTVVPAGMMAVHAGQQADGTIAEVIMDEVGVLPLQASRRVLRWEPLQRMVRPVISASGTVTLT